MESFLLKALPFGEFTASVVMCCFIIALYYKFSGMFDLQDEKLENVKKDAEYAKETSKYALKASKHAVKTSAATLKEQKKMGKTIDKIHDTVNEYRRYIDDKHNKSLTKQDN